MIEPDDNYKGGSVSYEFAKEFLDFHEEYIKKMSACLRKSEQILVSVHSKQVEEYIDSDEYKDLREFITKHLEDTNPYEED